MIPAVRHRPGRQIHRNQAERDIRPVKVQQRSSGGAWRTLDGLANFAFVQSYLSTAAKWGVSKLDALRQLFATRPGCRLQSRRRNPAQAE
jgi:hypothetical protein